MKKKQLKEAARRLVDRARRARRRVAGLTHRSFLELPAAGLPTLADSKGLTARAADALKSARAVADELVQQLDGRRRVPVASPRSDAAIGSALTIQDVRIRIRQANYLIRRKRLTASLQYLVAAFADTSDHRIGWAAYELSRVLLLQNVSLAILAPLQNRLPLARIRTADILEKRGLIDEAVDLLKRSRADLSNQQYSLMLQTMLKSPTLTRRDLLEEQKEWARRYCVPPGGQLAAAVVTHDRRLKVGYHCTFWNSDTIRNQLLPILRKHNKSRFEVFAYSPAPLEERLVTGVDHVRICGGWSDEDFVRVVRDDGIDILVECTGFSPGHRFTAMARRCAPVQVSYLNHTGTSGTPNVDYVIADEISVLPEEEEFYTERICRLPGSFFCFNFEECNDPEPGTAPFRRNGFVTFGCFGSHGKINGQLLDLWAEILKRTSGSILYVRNNELTVAENRDFMLMQMERRGVPEGRLLIREGTSRNDLVRCYDDVDISLDTWPYNGGNTIAESLWQGVPVVTLRGHRFSSRYGASLLSSSGCPELIASSPQEYVQLAVDLAHAPDRIATYRSSLRVQTSTHGFNNASAFASKLEKAFETMVHEKSEQPPEALARGR